MGAFPVQPNAPLIWERPVCKCFRFRQFYLCGCPDHISYTGRHPEHAPVLHRCEMWSQPLTVQEMARKAGFRHNQDPPIIDEPHVLPFPCYRHLMDSRVFLSPSELRRRSRRALTGPKNNPAIAVSMNTCIRMLQQFQKHGYDWESRKRLREEDDNAPRPPYKKRKYHGESGEVAALQLQKLSLQESRSDTETSSDLIMNQILGLQREELEYWRQALAIETETLKSQLFSAKNDAYLERLQRLEALANLADDQRWRNEESQEGSPSPPGARQFVVPSSTSSSPPSSGSVSPVCSDTGADAGGSPTPSLPSPNTSPESSLETSPPPSSRPPRPHPSTSSPPASYTTTSTQQSPQAAPPSPSPPAHPPQPQRTPVSRSPPHNPSLWRTYSPPHPKATSPFSSLDWFLEEQSLDLWALDGHRSRCPPPPKENRQPGIAPYPRFDGSTHTGYSRGAYKMDSDVLSRGWMRWDPEGATGRWGRLIVGEWFSKGDWSLGRSGYGFSLSME